MQRIKAAGAYGWRHRMQLFVNYYTLKHAHAPLPSWWQPLFQDLLTSPERTDGADDHVAKELSPLPMARATGSVACQVVRWEVSPSPPPEKQPRKKIAAKARAVYQPHRPLKPVQPVAESHPAKKAKQVG